MLLCQDSDTHSFAMRRQVPLVIQLTDDEKVLWKARIVTRLLASGPRCWRRA